MGASDVSPGIARWRILPSDSQRLGRRRLLVGDRAGRLRIRHHMLGAQLLGERAARLDRLISRREALRELRLADHPVDPLPAVVDRLDVPIPQLLVHATEGSAARAPGSDIPENWQESFRCYQEGDDETG